MDQPPIIDLQAIPLDPAPRRPRWVRPAVVIAAAFLLSLGLYCALAPRWAHRQATATERHAASRKTVNQPAMPQASGRPVYPYSVIPGGAYNSAELTRALNSDPLVAQHYSEFDRSKVTTARSLSARPVYVSYRIGDKIYWSRKPIRLKMGELLLTDGTHFARTRCGNRIALTVQSPVAVAEPIPAVLDIPVFVPEAPPIPAEEIAEIAPGRAPEIGPAPQSDRKGRRGWVLPVVVGGSVVGGVLGATHGGHGKKPPPGPPPPNPPPNPPPPPPSEVVPEPGFWVPCLIGFGAIVAVKSYRRRRAAKD